MTRRFAVTVPGGRFGPYAPLLMFAGDAAEARGARVVPITWSRADDPVTLPAHAWGPWVRGQVRPVLDELPDAKPLLIGKSLGTHAAALAAERDLPGVWLTPLLTHEPVVDALRRATAPCLLIGGTADSAWNGALARQLSPHVREIEGADHGLYVPGPLARSAHVLGEVVTAIERFLDEIVWHRAT